jgi:HEAT repeat protein
MMRTVVRNTLLAATLTASVAGCQMYEQHRPTFWPFPERKLTTYNTPAMRSDAVREFATKATGDDTPQQREITDQLARQIQVEPDPLVRQSVIKAIAEFRTPMAQQVLQAGLNDENEAVRIECCNALGRRAETASVASLAAALGGDKSDDVKMAAAKALGKIKSPEAIKALAVALDDRDPAMQYVGVQSLKSITGKDYGPDVQTWRQVAAGGTPPAAPAPSIAERMRNITPFK